MGKKRKKIHRQGRIHHANLVDPAEQIEQANKAYSEQTITCPFCGSPVTLGDIDAHDGTCPHCHASLCENGCDDAARAVLNELEPYHAAIKSSNRLKGRQRNLLGEPGLLKWFKILVTLILRLLAAARIRRLEPEAVRQLEKLGDIAQARYYAGDWYRQTRSKIGWDAEGWARSLHPWYDEHTRAFTLKGPRGNGERSGFRAEFEAFEELRRACSDPSSPLFGGKLAANLYLPYRGDRMASATTSRRPAPLWRQVDLVLVTCQQVFVVEVKRRAFVSADEKNYHVSVGNSRSEIGNADRMIDQVDDHADALCRLYPQLPCDRVLSALEFVAPLEIRGGFKRFSKGLFIGEGASQNATIVRAMERTCEDSSPILSERQRDDIAEELTRRFGDPCGTKHERHVRRLQEIRELWKAA